MTGRLVIHHISRFFFQLSFVSVCVRVSFSLHRTLWELKFQNTTSLTLSVRFKEKDINLC